MDTKLCICVVCITIVFVTCALMTRISESFGETKNDFTDRCKISCQGEIARNGYCSAPGEIIDEMPYAGHNHLPIPDNYKTAKEDYGYNFIPPEHWFRIPPRPPICVTKHASNISTFYANGAPVNVIDFFKNRVTPPDIIDVAYIKDKLNAGR